jgi:hypothetical protein
MSAGRYTIISADTHTGASHAKRREKFPSNQLSTTIAGIAPAASGI